MTTINYASLVLKDKNGNIGTVRTLSQTDIAKINNAVTVTARSGLPVYSSSVDYEVGFVVRSGTHIYQALVANGPDEPAGAQPVNNGTYWAQIGSVAAATTTTKGVVQLADNAAVTAGTAGRVIDAAQLKTLNAATATKLAAKRTIALSGAATGTATGFDGTANIAIPVTSLDASKLTGTASVSTTGNAATATKLAAKRTIALSGAATGTATGFDGSGNIVIPVTALSGSAITSAVTIYDLVPDGAAAHNCFYRGKDLTAAFDSGEFSEHVADGSFTDIFPGDFITKAITVSGTTYTVKWIIMELDYWLNTLGSTPVTAHHAVILPETPPFNAYMNSTNTTSGGYTQCAMYKNTIPAFAAGLTAAFGAGHILTFQEWFSTHTNDTVQSTAYGGWQGASTGWDGTEKSLSFTCNLMNSMMAFGAPIWSSSGFDSFSAVHQFAAFRMNPSLIYANRSWYWLRDIASSSHFAHVDGGGFAPANPASYVLGVRPFALLA